MSYSYSLGPLLSSREIRCLIPIPQDPYSLQGKFTWTRTEQVETRQDKNIYWIIGNKYIVELLFSKFQIYVKYNNKSDNYSISHYALGTIRPMLRIPMNLLQCQKNFKKYSCLIMDDRDSVTIYVVPHKAKS